MKTLLPLSVLIIEPNEGLVKTLTVTLEEAFFKAYSCNDLEKAQQQYFNEEHHLVMANLSLVQKDGLTFVEFLRQGKAGKKKDSPLILFAEVGEEILPQLTLYPFVHFLQKPFTMEKMAQFCQLALERQQKLQHEQWEKFQTKTKTKNKGKNQQNQYDDTDDEDSPDSKINGPRDPNGLELRPGDVLIREGEKHSNFYQLKEGTLTVYSMKSGKEVFLGEIHAGEVVGELSFIDNAPRSASVKAKTQSVVIKITNEKFVHMMDDQPPFIKGLIRTLCKRLRETNMRLKV